MSNTILSGQLFTIQHSPSTRTSSALTLIRPSVTASRKLAFPLSSLFGIIYRQHCDRYLTHPMNSPTPHLSTALSLQTEITALQQILSRLILFSLPVSTPNTIHHSRLPACQALLS